MIMPGAHSDAVPTTSSLRHAFSLGWTVSELFGRLRRYQPVTRRRPSRPRTLRRFPFANQEPTAGQRLGVAVERLIELCNVLDLMPPVLPGLTGESIADVELQQLHRALDAWSDDARIRLSGRSEVLGRAMTYGGSFADTYWAMADPSDPAFHRGRASAKELLRQHRLAQVQERMELLAQSHGPEVRDAVVASLRAWAWDDDKARWVTDHQRAAWLYSNLGLQAEIWQALVLGARKPAEFVNQRQRQRAFWVARLIITLFVLALAVGLGVLVYQLALALFTLVWNPGMRTQVESKVVETISTVVSILSTLATVIIAFFTRIFRMMVWLSDRLEQAFIWRATRKATTVEWNRRSAER